MSARHSWAYALNRVAIASDTSSAAAATTPVVVRAAAALASLILVPIAARSAAAVAITCGWVSTYATGHPYHNAHPDRPRSGHPSSQFSGSTKRSAPTHGESGSVSLPGPTALPICEGKKL